MFLANYADTLTDAPLDELVERFRRRRRRWSSMLAVPPVSTHHVVEIADNGEVTGVRAITDLMQWENGGYFVMRPEIFDVLRDGEDMVPHAFDRLVPAATAAGPARTAASGGPRTPSRTGPSWRSMYHRGQCPWMLWDRPSRRHGAADRAGGRRPSRCRHRGDRRAQSVA